MSDTEVVEIVPEEPKAPKPKPPRTKTPKKAKAKTTTKPKKLVPAKVKAKVAKAKVEKDEFGLRKGSAKSQAAAMYARKTGATLEEVKAKVGSVQLNVLGELEATGHKVKRDKQERKGKRAVYRYWLS